MSSSPTCPACGAALSAAPDRAGRGGQCEQCGAELGGGSILEIEGLEDGRDEAAEPPSSNAPEPPTAASAASSAPFETATDTAAEAARFAPGDRVGERYRMVSFVGAGAMGAVWRAEDVLLGEEVALKFLPPDLEDDPRRLAMLIDEVRLARAVSHPGVCRVHDLGEAEGLRFLSMEFVDGEDLASFLRRAGRPAPERAHELARELCAGLAAAHRAGVLHRDLKPKNVLIDSAGRARLTDFGLARPSALGEHAGQLAGTPAYMAPEQFTRREVSARSDVYALGLVLFELYTGRSPIKPGSTTEVALQHTNAELPSPREFVPEVDEAVDAVIKQCLAKDPAERPGSALEVAARIPGANALELAVEAGELPSPAMVAGAGGRGALAQRTALALFLACLGGLVLLAWLNRRSQLIAWLPEPLAPQVLVHEAESLLTELGWQSLVGDSAHGFAMSRSFLRHLEAHDDDPERWERLNTAFPATQVFWYRCAVDRLEPVDPSGRAGPYDPPLHAAVGGAFVLLGPAGNLIQLEVSPTFAADAQPEPVTWEPLFRAAGLDPASLVEGETDARPRVPFDERGAWSGSRSDPATSLEPVEVGLWAAAWRGRPVAFELFPRLSKEVDVEERRRPWAAALPRIAGLVMLLSALLTAPFLAVRNLRQGRADVRGATRVFAVLFALDLTSWALGAHLSTDLDDLYTLFSRGAGDALINAGVLWLLYVGLEPWMRRTWPSHMISWNRILSGGWSDPRVGRDVLVGLVLGLLGTLLGRLDYLVDVWSSELPPAPLGYETWPLSGTGALLSQLAGLVGPAVKIGLMLLLVLVGLRALVPGRRSALVLFGLIAFATTPRAFSSGLRVANLAYMAVLTALLVVAVQRIGLLALMSGIYFYAVFTSLPFVLKWGGAYENTALAGLLLVVGTAAGAAWIATGRLERSAR